ncbi:MAG: S41 family peptidase [Firmicutes bacterium]|nr:S41 family peptidase [Bacillota bacterium]
MFNNRKHLLTLLLGVFLLVGVAGYTTASEVIPLKTLFGEQSQSTGWEKLQEVIDIIQKRYVDRVDIDKVIDGAVAGAVRSLGDPYSDYFTPREWQDFIIRARGNYSGVGLTIGVKDKYIIVIAPVKGSPAARAGIKAGDRILKVDGKEMYDVSSDKAAEMIRGAAGTQVILTILPASGGNPVDHVLTRENIIMTSVEHRMVADNVGYIELSQFGDNAFIETKAALESLKENGARAFILDLRGNPGGLLDECVRIAELFVPEGPIVSVVDKDGKKDIKSSSSTGLGLPLVVLVDGGSASASEIVAGAVQDRKVGTIIGTKTFGKGLVQTLLNLREGSGLRLTTARYYTPSGRSIHGTGIEPDIIVKSLDQSGYEPLKISRNLGRMSIGLDVLALQQRLNHLGYKLEEDGIYGPATAGAVVSFQRANGFLATGTADSRTIAKVNEALSKAAHDDDPQLKMAIDVIRTKM